MEIEKSDNLYNEKVVVYTAISGNYDQLSEPEYINYNFDYICFSDNKKLKSEYWKIIGFPNCEDDLVMLNRRVKLLPHRYFPEYEYSVYIDGNFDIVGDLEELINRYLKTNLIAVFAHPERICIYDEARTCIDHKKGNRDVIKKQMQKYRQHGYPEKNGLIAGGIILRKHNYPDVVRLMEDWWSEINFHSKRDQLSFNYVSWKNCLKYGIIKGNIFSNSFFRYREHRLSYFEKVWKWANSQNRYNRPFRPIVKFIKKIKKTSANISYELLTKR